jgi:hypothetical protein
MKRLLSILFFSSCPAMLVSAQTQAEYERAMKTFSASYNGGDARAICAMFSDVWGARKRKLWTKNQITEMKKHYGDIKSFGYVAIDSVTDNNRLALFRVVCANQTFMTAFDLDDKRRFRTFRFHTSSPHIDSLLSRF